MKPLDILGDDEEDDLEGCTDLEEKMERLYEIADKFRDELREERRREDRLSQLGEYYKQTTKEQND